MLSAKELLSGFHREEELQNTKTTVEVFLSKEPMFPALSRVLGTDDPFELEQRVNETLQINNRGFQDTRDAFNFECWLNDE